MTFNISDTFCFNFIKNNLAKFNNKIALGLLNNLGSIYLGESNLPEQIEEWWPTVTILPGNSHPPCLNFGNVITQPLPPSRRRMPLHLSDKSDYKSVA